MQLALDFIHSDRSIFKIVDLDEAWAFLNVAQGETLSNKLVRAGRAMQAGVYFVTQSSGDVSKESLKNNILTDGDNDVKPDTFYYLFNVFTYQFSSFHDTQSRKSGKAGNREGV